MSRDGYNEFMDEISEVQAVKKSTEQLRCRHGGVWESVGEGVQRCSKCGDVSMDSDPDDYPLYGEEQEYVEMNEMTKRELAKKLHENPYMVLDLKEGDIEAFEHFGLNMNTVGVFSKDDRTPSISAIEEGLRLIDIDRDCARLYPMLVPSRDNQRGWLISVWDRRA